MLAITTQTGFFENFSDQLKRLQDAGFEVIEIKPAELGNYIQKADALLVGTEKVDGETIRKGENLKVIARYGVGYDAIDLKAASEMGIVVTNAPGCNANAVAELTMLDLLYCSRNLYIMNNGLRQGRKVRPLGQELAGKKIGVIGIGRIGKLVAKRCKAIDMDVYCNDIIDISDFVKENGLKSASKEEIFLNCDYITIHTPKTPKTIDMITKKEIGMMKSGVILINVSRGGLINEQDLFDALETGKVAAAAVDAANKEPAVDNPLVKLDNCLFTPHAGSSTQEAYTVMQSMAVDSVLEVMATGTSKNRVN